MSLFELLLTFNSSTQEAEENLPAKTTQWAPHLQSPSLACLRCYEMTLSLIHFIVHEATQGSAVWLVPVFPQLYGVSP